VPFMPSTHYLGFMKTLLFGLTLATTLLATALRLRADVTIDFENNPSLPAQPNNFNDAGAEQTYTQAGVYSVSGGVVLGNPTFLAAFPAHGTAPNLYGTTDIADPTLQSTLTFMFFPAQNFTSLSGVLFNGQTFAEDYTVTAHTTGGDQVITYTGVEADNSTSDFRNFMFTSLVPITGLDITTPDSGINGWDFFVDTVAAKSGEAAVPEPSFVSLLGIFMGGLVLIRRRKHS
jgi:hypothetical protein